MVSVWVKNIYWMSSFLLFCLILNTSNGVAQDINWPPKEWKDSVYVRYFKGSKFIDRNFYGKIVLTNGDTLRGIIRVTGLGCMFLESGKFESMLITVNDINYILGYNVVSLGQNFYMLKKLPKRRDLYRLVAQKGNVAIYDLQPDDFKLNNLGAPMLLVTPKRSIRKIYGGFWFANKHKLILKFINKRFHQSFKESDFKTEMDMIDYILDEENKRQ